MPSTSESLLVRIRQREDLEAWNRFVSLYTPLIYRWARQAGLDVHLASDLSQDVLAVVLQKIHEFQYNPAGSFRAWLRTIKLHQFRWYWRRRQRADILAGESWIQQLPDRAALESSWDQSYRLELLQRALVTLRSDFAPRTWDALLDWLQNADQSAEVVAGRHSVSPWTLYAAKRRLMKRLKVQLDGLWED